MRAFSIRNAGVLLVAATQFLACAQPADPDGNGELNPPAGQAATSPSNGAPALDSAASMPMPTAAEATLPGATADGLTPADVPNGVPAVLLGGRVDENPALPITGGTLLVTRDGQFAVAADPERDAIFVVDLDARAVATIPVPERSEVTRIAEGTGGLAYAVGRRGGALYVIDLNEKRLLQEAEVCAAPRGVAFDGSKGQLHVTCHSGKLLTLDASSLSPIRELQLDVDLRDVIVTGEQLLVSRFRSAEVLLLDASGGVVSRVTPDPFNGCAKATALYRMTLAADDVLYLSHQTASLTELGTGPGGYGSSCAASSVASLTTALPLRHISGWQGAGEEAELEVATLGSKSHRDYDRDLKTGAGPVVPGVTFDDDSQIRQGVTEGLPFRYLEHRVASVPVDLAVSAKARVVSLLAGNSAVDSSSNLWLGQLDPLLTSSPDELEPRTAQYWEEGERLRASGEPVAVAFDGSGGVVVQSREPAALQFEDGSILPLSDETRANTGHTLFHMTTDAGIACASCHPEGMEDGHTWRFPQGLRRTQTLAGGVMDRTPFHWDGELESMDALVVEVLMTRMRLSATPTDEQTRVFANWLNGIDTVPVELPRDAEAARRGQALFRDDTVGCAHCHSGEAYSDNTEYDVGTGGVFVTPTLLGISTRRPLMHDGCASSLEARFGLCGGVEDQHGVISQLDDGQVADLVEFMKTL